MFYPLRPSGSEIERIIASGSGRAFTYEPVGATRSDAPVPGFDNDCSQIKVGSGDAVFERCKAAISNLEMFPPGWVEARAGGPIQPGCTVVLRVWHLAFWSLFPARVVYVIDGAASRKEFGFAYGTLEGHAECGEELFTVWMDSDDDAVWYRIKAFSKPHHPLAKLGYPLVRSYQRAFVRESLARMTHLARSLR